MQGPGFHSAYHCRQGALAAVRRLVGQDGIDLAVGQAGLVKAHVVAEVVGEKHVLLGMLQLFPVAIVAYLLLVLLAERLPVQAVAGC